jgi:EAL domain-containing protein (putative c-di-GMP-specific phosphodiesterase class I)
VDDFGTGYSSLEYLRRLPVDLLKIDRTFAKDLSNDSNTVVLVDIMNQLAHAVGLRTIIEGIETEEQMNIIRLLACDEMQGYLIARPMPATEIEDLISRGAWPGVGDPHEDQHARAPGFVLSNDH